MIKNVLFDLDDTLLDFHKAEAEAIRFTLKKFGIDPSDENVQLYSRINRSCWAKLETGEFTRDEVLHRRFDILFDTLGIAGDSHRTQKVYEYRLSLGAYYLDGAKELLRLGIIFSAVPVGLSTITGIALIITKLFQPTLDESMISNEPISIGIGIMLIILSFICKHGAELADELQEAKGNK